MSLSCNEAHVCQEGHSGEQKPVRRCLPTSSGRQTGLLRPSFLGSGSDNIHTLGHLDGFRRASQPFELGWGDSSQKQS